MQQGRGVNIAIHGTDQSRPAFMSAGRGVQEFRRAMDGLRRDMRRGVGGAKVTEEVKRLRAEVAKLRTEASKGTGLRTMRDSLKGLAGAALGGYGMYRAVGAVKASVTAFASFEQQMALVSTMLGNQSMKLMPQYTAAIKRLSMQTGQSTGVLAQGLYNILSAGVDAGKALDVLTVATRAAIAGATDTNTAVDGLTTILNAYSLSAEKAAEVSDLMFQVVKDGKITFPQLAENIAKVAPTAKAAGLDLRTLMGVIATLVKVEKPERAMTMLATALMTAAKEGKNFLDVVRQMEGHSLEQITGAGWEKRSAQAIALLSQNVRALDDELANMRSSAGAAGEAFAKMAGTSAMKIDRMAQAWENLKRSLGEKIAPSLIEGLQRLTDAINGEDWKANARRRARDEGKAKLKQRIDERYAWEAPDWAPRAMRDERKAYNADEKLRSLREEQKAYALTHDVAVAERNALEKRLASLGTKISHSDVGKALRAELVSQQKRAWEYGDLVHKLDDEIAVLQQAIDKRLAGQRLASILPEIGRQAGRLGGWAKGRLGAADEALFGAARRQRAARQEFGEFLQTGRDMAGGFIDQVRGRAQSVKDSMTRGRIERERAAEAERKKALEDQARRIRESITTTTETYVEEFNRTEELIRRGLLTTEEAQAYRAKRRKALGLDRRREETEPLGPQPMSVSAVDRGLLTRAPGSQRFDFEAEQRRRQAEIAKNTGDMAQAVKESLTVAQAILDRISVTPTIVRM